MRIIRAREQVEMLEPWRTATENAPVKLYRGLNLDSTAPGMENVHSALQKGWDHPEVGGHVLNALQSGAHKGLGNHWTTDPEQASKFARWPNEETGQGGNMQALIEADWDGQGEDHNRTDTREFSSSGERIREFSQEKERTLNPGAGLNVTGVHVKPYDNDYWNGPDDGSPVDHDHDGPWNKVFSNSASHTAILRKAKDWSADWSGSVGATPKTTTVYHGTSPENANAIVDSQSWLPGNGGWFTPERSRAEAYGGSVISTELPSHRVPKDPEFYLPHTTRMLRKGPFKHASYYGHGPEDKALGLGQVSKIYNQARGNPEHPVTMYRALPHGNTSFNTGDWVTPSLSYARQHAMHPDDPSQDMPVIKSTVPAKHLHTDGNSIYEFGYNGPSHQGEVV